MFDPEFPIWLILKCFAYITYLVFSLCLILSFIEEGYLYCHKDYPVTIENIQIEFMYEYIKQSDNCEPSLLHIWDLSSHQYDIFVTRRVIIMTYLGPVESSIWHICDLTSHHYVTFVTCRAISKYVMIVTWQPIIM